MVCLSSELCLGCAGAGRLTRESEGSSGPHEESSGDEQNTETSEFRNCASQISSTVAIFSFFSFLFFLV